MKRTLPLVGAIACIIACLGLPLIASTLAALGLTFLLHLDWLFLPLAIALIAFVAFSAKTSGSK